MLNNKTIAVVIPAYNESTQIKTGISETYSKHEIIKKACRGELMEPKSTSHLIYCNKSKKWEPIMLLSSLFKLDVKTYQENQ